MSRPRKLAIQLRVNGAAHDLLVAPHRTLLEVLREDLGLTGAKEGCGLGACGTCTVLLDGRPARSCLTPVSAVWGEVTTIEGLPGEPELHAVQQAWIDHQVAQCGYCQPGQIMSAAAMLSRNPDPDDETIDRSMSGNLCRCGTYPRIREAIKSAAAALKESS